MALLQELKTHPSDRKLMAAYGIAALLSLAGAGALAIILVLIRTPIFGINAGPLYYQVLTGHAILGFVYWFAFIQAALLIAGATALRAGGRLWNLKLGWLAFLFTVTGLIINMIGVIAGASVLYTAFPPLSETFSATPLIYLGYVFAGAGALLIVITFIGTIFTWVEKKSSLQSWKNMLGEIHISSFASICAAVLIIPVALAAFRLYIPSFLWSMGWLTLDPMDLPMDFRMSYHVMFHVIHYIPAMAMIAAAYVLVELTTGAKSVYNKTVAKALFLMYPAVVPPTFLYHLMADPGIPQNIKIIGSALSLLIWVPSILHMFIITGMMEAKFRSAGYSVFGWIKHLPWKNPAFASLIMGMITFGFAGSLTSVLLQEQTAALTHGTFAVPAYIHPMVVGAASLIYMGIVYYGVTIFARRQVWGLALARIQPYLLSFALFIFAIAGSLAGYAGAPRRTAEVSYGGAAPESWAGLLNVSLGIGGVLTIIAGIIFIAVIGMTIIGAKKLVAAEVPRGLDVSEVPVRREFKYTPTALIPGVIFVVIVLVFTAVAIGVMGRWPIQFG